MRASARTACCIRARTSRDRCVLGDRVVLQAASGRSAATVSAGRFSTARCTKIPQIGIVELGDDVEIGANTCIDRAQTGVTSIGNGTKIDNLCQIGHNCRIGKHYAIAALTGLAGTTTIGDYVQVGGQSGFGGHLTVGSRAKIAARREVWGDVADDVRPSAARRRDRTAKTCEYRRTLRRLPKLYDRVEALERSRADGHSGEQ